MDKRELKQKIGMSEEEILGQIKAEFESSSDFTSQKRALYERRKKLYNNIEDQANKVYSKLLFSVTETLLALYVKDKPTVNFVINKDYFEDVEENIKKVAQSDYERMKMEERKERTQFNKFFYWVGIEVFDGFDQTQKTPEYLVISPMLWICDPHQSINRPARFHGFEFKAKKESLTKENGYFNIDQIQQGNESELMHDDKWSSQSHRYLTTADYDDTDCDINIYHHYTILNGVKCLCTLANDKWLLIRVQEIEPETDEEKKDHSLIPFPVVVRNWVSCDRDPRGISLCDMLEDKQTMTQLFLNLNKIKAEHEAWGDIFMYDPNIIEDISQLKTPSLWPKFVKASWLNSGWTPIVEVPRGQIKTDAWNMPSVLKNQAFADIGMDERSLWVTTTSYVTATENQRVQENSNLRQLLWFKRDARAEKVFWNLWYRSYQENFVGKKDFTIPWAWANTHFSFSAQDFLIYSNYYVEIKTVSEIEESNERTKLEMLALRDAFLADPNKSELAKRCFERKLYRLQGFDRDEIMTRVPESFEEMQAKIDLEFINRDEDPEPIRTLNEDHLTFLQIYSRAKDTDAKAKAINKRKYALLLVRKQQAWVMPMQQWAPATWQWQMAINNLTDIANSQNKSQILSSLMGQQMEWKQANSFSDIL